MNSLTMKPKPKKKTENKPPEATRGPVPVRLMRGPIDTQAVLEGCWYDKEDADRVVNFFTKFLKHSKGQWAGKAFVPLEWQEWDLLRPLYGWKRADGTRRFRRAYVQIPKKNGKSTICAGLALYMMIGDREAGAEVYGAAMDKEQAGIIYKEAESMVKQSPALKFRLRLTPSKRSIRDMKSGSFYRALSADVPTKEGLNIHCLIFDELHAQKTRVMWDTLKYGGASRRQPLFISISTAGSNRLGICYEQYTYAKKVLKGTARDTSFFAAVWEAQAEDDWTKEEIWRKANPGYGINLSADSFSEDFREAEETISSQNSFKRYRLNMWTQQEERWLDMSQWRLCEKAAPPLPADKKIMFFGGLDLASTQDIAAYVQLFYGQGFFIKPHFYIPKERLVKRVKRDKVPYDLWEQTGYLTATRGKTIDEEQIIEDVLKSCDLHKCREIAYDPWNAPHIVTRLSDEGVTMVPVRQGFGSMNYPSKELEKLVVSGKLNHGGNPIMEWMAGNVATETDAHDNIKPSKLRSGEKIDGIVATIMALSRYLVHTQPKRSKYENEGIVDVGAIRKKDI